MKHHQDEFQASWNRLQKKKKRRERREEGKCRYIAFPFEFEGSWRRREEKRKKKPKRRWEEMEDVYGLVGSNCVFLKRLLLGVPGCLLPLQSGAKLPEQQESWSTRNLRVLFLREGLIGASTLYGRLSSRTCLCSIQRRLLECSLLVLSLSLSLCSLLGLYTLRSPRVGRAPYINPLEETLLFLSSSRRTKRERERGERKEADPMK